MAYLKADHPIEMNEQEVRKALNALKPSGELFEIRILKKVGRTAHTMSGYFTDVDTAIDAMQRARVWKGSNVYFTLNEIDPSCYSREQRDQLIEASTATSDNDILNYKYLFVDMDPERASEVSSSNEEMDAAKGVAKNVIEYTRSLGWPEPIQGMSGNGFHLLYRIDPLPANQENDLLISNVLTALQQSFGTEECKIDCGNKNASRVCKLYGTVAHKGANTTERPHRLSRIINIPELLKPVEKEQLEAVAALAADRDTKNSSSKAASKAATKAAVKVDNTNHPFGKFDLVEWMEQHGLTVASEKTYPDGRIKYSLEECPFDPSHTGSCSVITLQPNGGIGFKCMHDSCKDKNWRDVWQKLDPDLYKRLNEAKQEMNIYLANPDASKPEKEKQQLTISGYDDIEIKPTDYLFFPWFPRGKLVAIQGDSSSSKSTIMYAVGALVTTGADLLGVPCEDPGGVMYLTVEDDPSDIKVAVIDSGGDISKVVRIVDRESIAEMDLSEAAVKSLNRIIKDMDIKLLVFDPIQQFLKGDMNKANETRPQMSRLMNLAEENNICIAFILHTGKDTSKSALHRGIGSVDIGASTRSMLQVVTDPENHDYKIMFTVKNNTASRDDTQKAIRYRIADHPDSFDHDENKRLHYHGHAEFVEILPNYDEKKYREMLRKSDDAEIEQIVLEITYDTDPLVVTARELVRQNPNGLYIGNDDLIEKITECSGSCPYVATNDKVIGLNRRIESLRTKLAEEDGIQADVKRTAKKYEPYNWNGEIFSPDRKSGRGVQLTPVKSRKGGFQQTKF